MNPRLTSRLIHVALPALLIVCASSGCSSKAHSDLYQQRMANEIRILEDQLYDADYENRVLHDELKRLNQQTIEGEPEPPSSRDRSDTESSRLEPPQLFPESDDDEGELDVEEFDLEIDPGERSEPGTGGPSDLELPTIDEGIAVDPESLADPDAAQNDAAQNDAAQSDPTGPEPTERQLPQAPGGPEPPSKSDTEIPQVMPGELVPPPQPGTDEELPRPGKIDLPDSAQSDAGVPERIEIHPGLSGQLSGGDTAVLKLVIQARDQSQKTVPMERYDINASLKVVVTDPAADDAAPPLGSWDFDQDRVRQMVRAEPVSGIHIPIDWTHQQPSGSEVIVQVSLFSGDAEMKCQRRLRLEDRTAQNQWTPRGDRQQR